MLKIIPHLLAIFCVCFIEIYSNEWDPFIWPETFVDDGKPFVEFTCGAYLKSEEWLSWYKGGDIPRFINEGGICTTVQQPKGVEGYRIIKLLWPVVSLIDNKVYCSKQNESRAGSWRTTDSKSIRITSTRKLDPHSEPQITAAGWGPWLVPAEFVDDGRPVFEFTSYAYLKWWNTLVCYQEKATKSVIKLGMIHQETNYGYVKITLRKTLEASDNGSQIYCTRYQGNNWFTSQQRMTITLYRQFKDLEPYVTVQPSTDVVFFDEGDAQEFVCGGSKPVDGRALTWYLQTPGINQFIPSDQKFLKTSGQNHLTLPMEAFYHGKLLYCAQDFTYRLGPTKITSYGELARSQPITLLHRPQCNTKDKPRVIPETFIDEHKFFRFTCYAFLEIGQLLSWYQSKGLNKTLLRTTQLQELNDPRSKDGEWIVLVLNKTLEQADNSSEVYCAKETVLPDGGYSEAIDKSERIPIVFQREIPSMEKPYIRIEPNDANITFVVNTTIRLTCGGSRPVDGRNYTWFREDANSTRTIPKEQKYDPSDNLNVIELSLNESYNMNKLSCVQGLFAYIRRTDGSLQVKIYGELVSKTITLIQEEGMNLVLMVTIPLVILLVVALACLALRRRRATPTTPATPVTHVTPAAPVTHVTPAAPPASKDTNDDIYGNYVNVTKRTAPPELTYASLDLPRPTAAREAAPETLYAEISGVYSQQH